MILSTSRPVTLIFDFSDRFEVAIRNWDVRPCFAVHDVGHGTEIQKKVISDLLKCFSSQKLLTDDSHADVFYLGSAALITSRLTLWVRPGTIAVACSASVSLDLVCNIISLTSKKKVI